MSLESSRGSDQHEPAVLEVQPIRRSLTFDRASTTVGASSAANHEQDAAIDSRLSSLEALRDKLRRINERAQNLTRSTASGDDDRLTEQPHSQQLPASAAWQPRSHLADSTSSVSSLALSDLSDLTTSPSRSQPAPQHVTTRSEHPLTRPELSAGAVHSPLRHARSAAPPPSPPDDEALDVTAPEVDNSCLEPQPGDITFTSSGVGASVPSTPLHRGAGTYRPQLPLESPMSKSVAALQSLQASSQSRLQQQLQQHHTEMATATSSVDWAQGTRTSPPATVEPQAVSSRPTHHAAAEHDDLDDQDEDLLADEVIFAPYVTRRGDGSPPRRLDEVHLDDASWTPPRRAATAVYNMPDDNARDAWTPPKATGTAVDNSNAWASPSTAVDNSNAWTPPNIARTGVVEANPTDDVEARAAAARPRMAAGLLTPRSTKVRGLQLQGWPSVLRPDRQF